MRSCLYECHVLHHRLTPREHRFVYRLFLLALDLDEWAEVGRRVRWLGLDRRGPYAIAQRDYCPTEESASPGHEAVPPPAPEILPLKRRLLAWLRRRGVAVHDDDRVLLITLPRILGYAFNPVSFYFVTGRDGAPRAAVAEVTNTFREVKLFALGTGALVGPGVFRQRLTKEFYVSPFSAVDVAFDFTLRVPGERLSLQIDDYAAATRTLTSTLAGPARTLTSARLAWFLLKYPLLTLLVTARIHWHALQLWLKQVPWWPKAARAAEQRDLLRPHASLVPRTHP